MAAALAVFLGGFVEVCVAAGTPDTELALRKFRIRIERFAGAGSKVVTVKAVNRASAWSLAAAEVDAPDNIWRMTMLRDNGRRLRLGLHLPDGEPDFYGGVPVEEAVERAHEPTIFAGPWMPGDARGIDAESRLYLFGFDMFTEVSADTFAYARNRTEAWSIAAFEEAVGQISALWLTAVGATTVGHRPDWLGNPDEDDRVTWDGEQLRIYEDIPYGGVTVDLTDADKAIDVGSILMMRHRAEEAERREAERRLREIPNLVAVVLGGSSSIGRMVAEVLAGERVRVAIVGPNQEDPEAVAAEIRMETGAEVLAVATDVGSDEQVQAMTNRVRDHYGRIDMVFNETRTEDDYDEEGLQQETDRLARNIYGLLPDEFGYGEETLFESMNEEQMLESLTASIRLDLQFQPPKVKTFVLRTDY